MATQRVENLTARNAAIARAAYEAYVTKDRAALDRLIAEDFHFTSALDNHDPRPAHHRCRGVLWQVITSQSAAGWIRERSRAPVAAEFSWQPQEQQHVIHEQLVRRVIRPT
jgi:hypothetical protein